ncbi:apoptosis-associated speck-like protein containing a CARD [Cololabis saira]|uniref:apoptosis-associated speck-like protein containing a CARD n=1 Tax=Cololabis saira TaxID=129043 RepID=UPI002AD3CB66|nr:apoptosis-associated speck-like protein containing a CARD [Cololabis saira]
MAQKNPTRILKKLLNHLSVDNFKEFCDALLDRREEPCVPRVKVEGKSRLEIGNVMINTFTEQGALKVAEEILREIGCSQAADKLAKEAGPAGPARPARPAGPAGPAGQVGAPMKHFVDEDMKDFLQRVSNHGRSMDEQFLEILREQEPYLLADLKIK